MSEKLPVPAQRAGQLGEIIDEAEKYVILPGEVSQMNPARVLIEAVGRMCPYSPGNLVAQVVLPYLAEQRYQGWGLSCRGFGSDDRGIVNLEDNEIAIEVRKILVSMPEDEREGLQERLRRLINNHPEHMEDFLSKPEGYWGP